MKIYEAYIHGWQGIKALDCAPMTYRYFLTESDANEWLAERYEEFKKRCEKKEDVFPFEEMTALEVYDIKVTEKAFIKFLNSLTHNERWPNR